VQQEDCSIHNALFGQVLWIAPSASIWLRLIYLQAFSIIWYYYMLHQVAVHVMGQQPAKLLGYSSWPFRRNATAYRRIYIYNTGNAGEIFHAKLVLHMLALHDCHYTFF